MKRQVHCKGRSMRIVGEMTIYTATALWKQVSKTVGTRTATQILDLSEVTEFDTAGLQIVLMARRLAGAAGRELQISEPSPAVSEVLALLQLQEAMAAPVQGRA
jgi:anti-sigma B factor antagonist